MMSLPSRERGLKLEKEKQIFVVGSVAPLAGAWIEIRRAYTSVTDIIVSLPSRERGLK